MTELLEKEKPSLKYFCILLISVVVLIMAGWFLLGRARPKSKIRNVLLISIDTCRADYLGCYGGQRKTTPNIDAIAQEAIVFENTIAPVPLTLPSHTSILTGTNPPYHGVHDNAYIVSRYNESVAEVLRKKGIVTGAVIGAFVLDSQFGLDQGFETYNDEFEEEVAGTSPVNQRRGQEVSRFAIEWLKKKKDERFFLFVHYYDPHQDYNPPEPFASEYSNNLYAGEIAYTDFCIGQVIKELKQLNLYDSTLIIITSDHGEMLGEHGENTHGYFIYKSAIKVPLIIKIPGKTFCKRVSDAVGLIDIVPSIYRFLGISIPEHIQGEDLSIYFSNSSNQGKRRYFFCESFYSTKYGGNSLFGVTDNKWKYIQTTRPELYNLEQDPAERVNLFDKFGKRAHLMKEILKSMLEVQVRREMTEEKISLDSESIRRLQALGYVSGDQIVESFAFDSTREDPKDLIEFHKLNSKADGLISIKDFEQAEVLCKEMLKKRPAFFETYRYLGKIAFEKKEMEVAISQYTRYLEYLNKQKKQSDTELPQSNIKAERVHLELGQALVEIGKNKDAMEHFKEALRITTDKLGMHFQLADIFEKSKKFDKAIKHYESVLMLKPETGKVISARERIAKILMSEKNFEQAIEQYKEILQIIPDNHIIYNNLALALSQQGKMEEAINCWEKSLGLEPKQAEVCKLLGNAKVSLGRFEESIKHWKESLKINVLQPEIHKNLAIVYHKEGKFNEVVKHCTEALRQRPDWLDVQNSLAWVKSVYKNEKIHNPNEAVQLAKHACNLTKNNNPGFLDTLAVAYAAAGEFSEAIKTAEKALKLAQSSDQQNLAKEIAGHLELFRKNQPYYVLE